MLGHMYWGSPVLQLKHLMWPKNVPTSGLEVNLRLNHQYLKAFIGFSVCMFIITLLCLHLLWSKVPETLLTLLPNKEFITALKH